VPESENLPPAYPRLARRRGYEGLVVLLIRVSTGGMCLSVEVLESSGHTVLDRAAVAAVKKWRFKPASTGAAAVEAEVEVPIRFRLTE
jgi:protein TonB